MDMVLVELWTTHRWQMWPLRRQPYYGLGVWGLVPCKAPADCGLDPVCLGEIIYSFLGMLCLCSEKDFYISWCSVVCPGWESQLLETGFLAIFLCPLWTLSQVPRCCPPSLISIWTFRWLIVRIMLGAVSKTLFTQISSIGFLINYTYVYVHFQLILRLLHLIIEKKKKKKNVIVSTWGLVEILRILNMKISLVVTFLK